MEAIGHWNVPNSPPTACIIPGKTSQEPLLSKVPAYSFRTQEPDPMVIASLAVNTATTITTTAALITNTNTSTNVTTHTSTIIHYAQGLYHRHEPQYQ